MPLSDILTLGGIISAFMLFALALAWGQYQTQKVGNDGPARPQLVSDAEPEPEIKKAA